MYPRKLWIIIRKETFIITFGGGNEINSLLYYVYVYT